MGNNGVFIAFITGGVITAMVTGFFSLMAARTAAQTARLNTTSTTRADVEKEAFARAKVFYTDTIDRQDAEIKELTREIRELKNEVRALTDALRAHDVQAMDFREDDIRREDELNGNDKAS